MPLLDPDLRPHTSMYMCALCAAWFKADGYSPYSWDITYAAPKSGRLACTTPTGSCAPGARALESALQLQLQARVAATCDMQEFCLSTCVGSHSGRARRGLTWTFDLAGIGEMYASYEATSLWPFLRRPVAGARVSFVRAEGSNYRWAGGDEQRITALGHDVHLLRRAGAPPNPNPKLADVCRCMTVGDQSVVSQNVKIACRPKRTHAEAVRAVH